MTDSHQHEMDTLLTLMKTTKDKQMYERYQTIYNYVNAYEKKGLDGLIMGQSPGAPRKLTPEQELELAQVIATKLPL